MQYTPYVKTLRTIIVLVFFIVTSNCAFSQIGVKYSYFIPNGDIGQLYNKGSAFELYAVRNMDDNPAWRQRAGILYTKLTPRMDTVPLYVTQIGGTPNTLIVPGYLVTHKFSMYYLYIDFSRRLVRFSNFSLFAGAGIDAGVTHVEYDRGFETIITEHSNKDILSCGYKVTANIEYKINRHLDILFEASRHGFVPTDWSSKLTHFTYSIGINYFINKRDDDDE